ncbi:Flp pilus assembly protein CpaB [Caproicibacter fermentans]|uniref:Pilus assembly protein CpaB n=1 Tax=Caproicibacter fermentans TaxID=2576756 RepID=A0A7G8TD52_9FIRM|nr:RcpC/CpaB family pilus assembly protein [Caproicibacter fermentans]QNK41543.1 pilus assembly protein CpaB [Caproicibacter fermentans]
MKKLFRNRTFLASLAIVLALVICFVAAPSINAAAGKEVSIVRVTKNISKGTKLTKDMVENVKVGGYNLPDNVLKSDSGVIGKYATASLQPGDYILSSKVSEDAPDIGLSSLDGKKQAVSVSIKSFAAGLSGKLESGDVIQLYVADYGGMKDTLMPTELQYVKLLAATTDKGIDNTDEQKKDDKSNDEMPSTLTVLVSPVQADKLVDYENNGKLHAALVYRGSESNSKKFLDLEDQYLDSLTQDKTGNTTPAAPSTVTGGK